MSQPKLNSDNKSFVKPTKLDLLKLGYQEIFVGGIITKQFPRWVNSEFTDYFQWKFNYLKIFLDSILNHVKLTMQ